MDKLAKYRDIIEKIIRYYGQFQSSFGKVDTYAICDRETDNYLVLDVGWLPSRKRQHAIPIHIRIKDGKVWLEWDGTDEEIAQQLIDAGIAEEDMVYPLSEEFHKENRELMAA